MIIRLFLIVFGLFLCCACQPKPDATVTETKATDMSATELPIPSAWSLVSCEHDGKTMPAANNKAFIAIRDGQIGGHSGCNAFGGDWTAKGKKMKVPGVMASKMYCEDCAMQERLIFDLLNGTVVPSVSGSKLTLANASTTLTLRRNDKLLK